MGTPNRARTPPSAEALARRHERLRRDAGIAQVRRTTGWLAFGSFGLAGAFSAVTAMSYHATHRVVTGPSSVSSTTGSPTTGSPTTGTPTTGSPATAGPVGGTATTVAPTAGTAPAGGAPATAAPAATTPPTLQAPATVPVTAPPATQPPPVVSGGS